MAVVKPQSNQPPDQAQSIISGGEVPTTGAAPNPDYQPGAMVGGSQQPAPAQQQQFFSQQPTPVLGDTNFATLIQSAVRQVGAGTDQPQEIAQPSTQIPKTMQETFVPGYQMLSYNSAYLEPFKYNYQQMVQFQRSLALAGYLGVDKAGDNAGTIQVSSLGFYDAETRMGMEQLLVDARDSGWNPRDILKYRMDIARGKKPHTPKTASLGNMEQMTPEDHIASLDDAYAEVWGRKAPPGYTQQYFNFNPDELKAYERAKLTFQNSDVSQESQQRLLGMLQQLFQGNPQQAQAAGGGR